MYQLRVQDRKRFGNLKSAAKVEKETFLVKWENESLTLPAALSYQAAYIYIIAVYFKSYWEPWR